jgi:hypothetical protein
MQMKANAIAVLHLLWLLWGIANLPLMFMLPGWHYVTLVFAGTTLLSWMIFRGCWLLQMENRYRAKVGGNFPDESFIQHYLRTLVGISVSRTSVRAVIYAYLAISVLVALLVSADIL